MSFTIVRPAWWLGCAAACWAAAPVLAQQQSAPLPAGEPAPAADAAPASASTQRIRPSGRAILELLDHRDPPATPIPPSIPETQAPPPGAPGRLLWPGGHRIAGRSGRLEQRGGAWFFVFDDEEGEQPGGPVRVLENTRLAQMETYLASAPGRQVGFNISAEVTEYRGENALLIREVTIRRPAASGGASTATSARSAGADRSPAQVHARPGGSPAAPNPAAPNPAAPNPAASNPAAPNPAAPDPAAPDPPDPAAPDSAAPAPDADPSAGEFAAIGDLVSSFAVDEPESDPLPPPPASPAPAARLPDGAVTPAESTGFPAGSRHPEDARLVDRLGRLIREDGQWSFAFESDSDRPAEPPLRLHPNRALERLEEEAAGGGRRVIFRVSGDISEYRGQNYLLVKRFVIQQDHGNLQ